MELVLETLSAARVLSSCFVVRKFPQEDEDGRCRSCLAVDENLEAQRAQRALHIRKFFRVPRLAKPSSKC
jgi:hypothetical protein